MVNFYHRFIPSAAAIMRPLFQCLASKPKDLIWSKEAEKAFEGAKTALANTTMLEHPRASALMALTVDASDVAVGAVLELQVGKLNIVADALSRPATPEASALSLGVDYEELAAAQQVDAGMEVYRNAESGLKLAKVPCGTTGVRVLCDVSMGKARPIVPIAWRRRIFDTIHSLAHLSIRAASALVAAKFVWHRLRKQVTAWARSCVACQTSKIQRHVRPPVQDFAVPDDRFHVHADLVGPLPCSHRATHLLTIVDRFTRWAEAIPLTDISAEACARAIISHWIARFGVPSDIATDRGAQFTSSLWCGMAQLYGAKLQQTTAYLPESNGLVERFHRHLKSALKARLTSPDWVDQLPWVLLGIRTTPKMDLNASSAELVYGSVLRVPGDFLPVSRDQEVPASAVLADLRERACALVPVITSRHGSSAVHVPTMLRDCAYVFLRKDAHRSSLQRAYEGPYRVLRTGTSTFTLDMGGKEEFVSMSRLKPAHVDEDSPVAASYAPEKTM
ncbi:uncharacterized protein LOC116972560 [Amblyraja radiata]|uniref:uncharacterized protein LOC116972560 n=1 Tax=Amblyraja radiata TaxID=386614 RepID=UPI0014040399|nr:uncharacterized protein LOC116972560 [Amblyraja radiata]